MSRLISEIGDAYAIFQKIADLDNKIESLRNGTYSNLAIMVNGRTQDRSAVEALAPAMLSFFQSKRRTLAAALTERGFEDG